MNLRWICTDEEYARFLGCDGEGCEICCYGFKEPIAKAHVYRPHRRMVVWAMLHQFEARGFPRMPQAALQARLGCPEARAWVRHRRRATKRFNALRRGQKINEFAGWWDVEGDLPECYLGTGLV